MSEQNQSFLRFSLEESIWFPKGYEVSELDSLSIEPDVNIIEKDQYVVIEGNLDISGEYRGFANQQENEPLEAEQSHRQLVQDVFFREEDSIHVFNHQFPVDISIPANRVEDRSAIEVDISTFDYSMPESNCIKLISELMISGIYEGAGRGESSVQAETPESFIQTPYVFSEPEEVVVPESSFHEIPTYESISFSEDSRTAGAKSEEEAYESFSVEAYALPRQESAEDLEVEVEGESAPSIASDIPSFSKPLQEPSFSIPMPVFKAPDMDLSGMSDFARNKEESQQIGRKQSESEYWSVEDDEEDEVAESAFELESADHEETSIAEFGRSEEESLQISFHRSEEVQDEMEEEVTESAFELGSADHEETSIAEFGRSEEESLQISFHRSEEVRDESEKKEVAETERSGSMTVSLTDFFGKKDTQTHTRLKVCIVQAGDSLNEIASRYEVSRLDLLNLNELDSENDLKEGHVLYIPQKTVR